jgi:RNA polymerase sigma factor (sigma-70 family)
VMDPGSVVFVVDDDASMREAIESLLRSAGLAVRSFSSALEFLARPPHDAPACLVLDVRLPGASGLDLQRELAERDPLPIVFITGHGDIRTSVRAMKAGAVEFLPKPFRDEDLLEAIKQALESARRAWRERADLTKLHQLVAALTPRERQVFSLVVTGMLNKQIAYELGISEVTVKGHRGQVMQKLRAGSVADLVRMAGRVGVVPVGCRREA